MDQALAVTLALTAAFLFAVSNVVEHQVATRVPDDHSLRLRLLVVLARRPAWLGGFASDVGGYGAQAAALGFGALLVVAPLLACGLLFSLLLEAGVHGRRLPLRDAVAAGLLCGGLAVFLAVGSPTSGHFAASAGAWAPAAAVAFGVIGVCVLAQRRLQGAARATALGLAGGMAFGVNAAMTKTVVHVLGSDDPVSVFWHWELYALSILSVGGLLIVQSAFQAGPLAASLPALEVTEPIVATFIGVVILHEQLHARTNGDRAVIAAAALAMMIGLVRLARAASTAAVADGHAEPAPREEAWVARSG
jgi:drug/metabolite transporter (DMT)-like permease